MKYYFDLTRCIFDAEFNRRHPSVFAVLHMFMLFSFIGIFSLYVKAEQMNKAWWAIARFIGRSDEKDLSFYEKLSFFSSDFMINFILFPLSIALVTVLLPRRMRLPAGTFFAFLWMIILFISFQSYSTVGRYLTKDMFFEAVRWGFSHPEAITDYASFSSLVKFGLLLSLVAAALFLNVSRTQKGMIFRMRQLANIGVLCFSAASVFFAIILTLISQFISLPSLPQNQSLVRIITSAWLSDDVSYFPDRSLSADELIDRFRDITHTPLLTTTDRFIGSSAGSDVLLFVMETGPARSLDLAREGENLAGAGKLYPQAFVAEKHYTSYPYTSDSLFSILSGYYPEGRRRLLDDKVGNVQSLGLFRALRTRGYISGVYSPSIHGVEHDERMYKSFGADFLYFADEDLQSEPNERAMQQVHEISNDIQYHDFLQDAKYIEFKERLLEDIKAWDRLKTDLVKYKKSNQHFCLMFLPQLGHAPWFNLKGKQSIVARGRDIMLLQDLWLKELVDLLENNTWLENTIIIVTADHGIRTRSEDPDLMVGKLSDYMFRVPLLIYAPKSLRNTITIKTPTSHVDISPTVLALLGLTDQVREKQGTAIWQRSSRQRLYFYANVYGGADGFVQDDFYYMRQEFTGAVYKSTKFEFTDDTMITDNKDEISMFATDAIRISKQIQNSFIEKLIAGNGLLN